MSRQIKPIVKLEMSLYVCFIVKFLYGCVSNIKDKLNKI